MTAGSMARAADDGHRVVAVFATRGELGETPPGLLADGETLAQRRTDEARRSGEVLGAARVEFLPFHDSGMAGSDTVDAPGCVRGAPTSRRRPRTSPRSCARSRPTCSPCTTSAAATSTPTTSRCTTSAVAPPSSRARRASTRPRSTPTRCARRSRCSAPRRSPLAQADARPARPRRAQPRDPRRAHHHPRRRHAVPRPASAPAMAAHESQISEEAFFLALPDDLFARTLRHRVVRAARHPSVGAGDLAALSRQALREPRRQARAQVVRRGRR